MKRYLLDTNMVSFLLKERSPVFRRVANLALERLCISAVTKDVGSGVFPSARVDAGSFRSTITSTSTTVD